MAQPKADAPKRKHKKLRIVLLVLALFFVYLLAGSSIPFLIHPEVDEAFQAAFDPQTFYTTGSPDRASLVVDNEEALDARMRIISEAQERVIFTNFDIRTGESGRDMAAALLDAADRGVQVQILTDGFNGTVRMEFSPIWQALGSHPNVEIRFYNTPNPLLPWTFHGRLHDKYIIIDDRLLLTGGRNTFDKFLGDYVPTIEKSRDLETLFYNSAAGTVASEGSVISQTKAYFDYVWNGEECTTHLESVPFWGKGAAEQARLELKERYRGWRSTRPELFGTSVDYSEFTVPLDGVTLITNPTHIYSKEPLVWWQLQQFMERAQERVYLQTPYAICSAPMYTGLARVAAKGIPFEMQINSTGVGDNFMGSSDYLHNKGKLLNTGVTIWEWYGDYSSHGKSLLIDRNLSAVGSYNLDMRSTYIDTEMMFVVHSEAFNSLLEGYLQDMEDDSLQVTGAATYAEKSDLVPWDNGAWLHKLLPITSWLLQPFRFLL